MRVGIAGFGRLVREYYVPAIATLPEIQIVAVADPLADSQAAAARRFPGAQVVADSSALFEESAIDALIVASPPSTHLKLWNEAARRKIPVLMEKPFVLDGEMVRAACSPDARPLLMPNFNRRWWPAYRAMRQMCAENRVGEIESARFTLRVDVERWSTVTRHRLAPAEGGPLYDLGSAELDLIEFVLGERIESVGAGIGDGSDRQVQLAVTLTDGVRVECELAYASRNRESISIVGSRASLSLENPNFALHVVDRGQREFPLTRLIRDGAAVGLRAAQRSRSMLRHTIRAALAEFIDALKNGRPFSPSFHDAAHNSACLAAASKALATHSVVVLEPEGNGARVLQAHA